MTMISIKVKFQPALLSTDQGYVYYQLMYERRMCRLNTNYRIYNSEWDNRRSVVAVRCGAERVSTVVAIREHIRLDLERLTRISHDMDMSVCSLENVIDEFNRYIREYTLFHYMDKIILQLQKHDRVRTAETYSTTLSSFKKFRNNEDIMLDCITSEVIEGYETYLRSKGLTLNTISFYMRILRAVYNRAVENNIIVQRYPFRRVYTGIARTVKRALPLAVIRQIKALNLSAYPSMDFARDMFLFSFYMRGMSFVDMAYLRKCDLNNGYVTYRRRKTGKSLSIAWTDEMQRIVDKYPANPTHYLLPIICHDEAKERSIYRNTAYNINRNLKKVAELVEVSTPLTLYCARHSWASAAKVKGVPLSVISDGMGHTSEATTQIYLASLDMRAVDRANMLIINSI